MFYFTRYGKKKQVFEQVFYSPSFRSGGGEFSLPHFRLWKMGETKEGVFWCGSHKRINKSVRFFIRRPFKRRPNRSRRPVRSTELRAAFDRRRWEGFARLHQGLEGVNFSPPFSLLENGGDGRGSVLLRFPQKLNYGEKQTRFLFFRPVGFDQLAVGLLILFGRHHLLGVFKRGRIASGHVI